MNIAIPISAYMWAGGAELIGNFLTALIHTYPSHKYYLLHNSRKSYLSKLLKILYAISLVPSQGLGFSLKQIKNTLSKSDKFFSLTDFLRQDPIFSEAKLIETDYSLASLNELRDKYCLDVIFAASYPINSKYLGRWVGYVTDVQHRHFPRNFAWFDRARREYIFSTILSNASRVAVNSHAVKKDLGRFYGREHLSKISVLPVSPFPRSQWLAKDSKIITKYSLPAKFFLISSQLWVHKNHLTAFKALAVVVSQHKDIHLVCTGDTMDYRHPTYFSYLQAQISKLKIKDHIHFLGLIPKNDQIQIMRNSIAVIQPSTFEGGPGGGAVQNAISLGVRSIVADIPINREINDSLVSYFEPGSSSDLAVKMIQILSIPISSNVPSIRKLGRKRESELAKAIMQIINQAVT